ncbi:MAG: ester cyclase [Methanomassiliicoccus sp.]|nr:ester cyclase [Methanomassiliicoccus sp.]
MTLTEQGIEEMERNKEIVRRVYDGWNRGSIDEFKDALAADFKEHTRKGDIRDRAACIAETERFLKNMPDARFDVQEMIAEGDRVVVVQRFTGTMDREVRGMEPAGQKVDMREVDIYRIEGGKIAELWVFLNDAG